MARIRPTGAGKPRHTRSGARASKRTGRKHATRHAAHKPKPAQQARPASLAAERLAASSAWGSVASLNVSPTPLLALRPEQPAPDELLALVGAEQTTLREALRAWSAAQDQAANRAWRRPGGLTRMAGL